VAGSLGDRKKALKHLVAVLSDAKLATVAATQCWGELNCLVNVLVDKNSSCRENAALILTSLVPHLLVAAEDEAQQQELFANLVSAIKLQLVGDDSVQRNPEEVEEARAKLLVLLETLLAAAKGSQLPEQSTELLVTIVTSACLDLCPDVKKVGCTCTAMITGTLELTEEQWDSLLQSLAYDTNSAIGHQQYKVTVASVDCALIHHRCRCEKLLFVRSGRSCCRLPPSAGKKWSNLSRKSTLTDIQRCAQR
jgi:hypothetical protein